MKKTMNIGVFDSGLGGLTILKELLKKLPGYNYIYLGDNARVPYGNRSDEMIYRFTKEAVKFLFEKDCKIVILACNTATSTSLRRIQKEFLPAYYKDRRVLGVIKPTVEKISEKKYKKIGVVGTKATVKSKAFVRELKKATPLSTIIQQETPLLVPFIEDGLKHKQALRLVLKKYLETFIDKKPDGLILGCTHYGLIKKEIGKILGETEIVCESKPVAEKFEKYLKNHPEIEKKLGHESKRKYYVTDSNSHFCRLFRLFLGKSLKDPVLLQTVKIDR